MRRIITLLLTAIIAVSALSSCASTLPARFDSFATTVERRADNYSLKDWQRKNDKFKDLCAEYKDNHRMYTTSEKRRIYESMATYVKAAGKSGVIAVTDTVSAIGEQITSFIADAKEFFESLGIRFGRK
ncbi:MAG: hypothetical protein MJZ16_09490 [Bacteroidales bacterium]|nr:hypothetical protein [Bacteroidales bacterium]